MCAAAAMATCPQRQHRSRVSFFPLVTYGKVSFPVSDIGTMERLLESPTKTARVDWAHRVTFVPTHQSRPNFFKIQRNLTSVRPCGSARRRVCRTPRRRHLFRFSLERVPTRTETRSTAGFPKHSRYVHTREPKYTQPPPILKNLTAEFSTKRIPRRAEEVRTWVGKYVVLFLNTRERVGLARGRRRRGLRACRAGSCRGSR